MADDDLDPLEPNATGTFGDDLDITHDYNPKSLFSSITPLAPKLAQARQEPPVSPVASPAPTHTGGGYDPNTLFSAPPPRSPATQQDSSADSGWGIDKETLKDVGLSAAIGVPKGLMTGAGSAGDVRHFLSKGVDYLGETAGVSPENIQKFKDYAGDAARFALPHPMRPAIDALNYAPTSDQIKEKVQSHAGEFYEPKTGAGHIAQSVTEFAANPTSYMGPGSALLKGTTAAAAGLGSELAGQGAEALGAEEHGLISVGTRLAGAIAAGKIPHSVVQAQFRRAVKNAASTEQLFDTADNLYDLSRNSGVMLKPNVLRDLSAKIIGALKAEGHDEINVPMAWRKLEKIADLQNNLGLVGIKEVQAARKALGKVASSSGANSAQEREAARFAIAEINQYMSHLPMADVQIGASKAVKQAVQDWRSADKAYSAGMRAEQLEDALTAAIDRAKSTGKGTNVENAMRQNMRRILDSRVKSRGFSPDEITEMRSIIRGDTKGNVLRGLGALAPTGIVSGALGLEIGHALFSGAKMFAPSMAGHIAKKLSDRKTARNIEDLISGVRLRGSDAPMPARPPSSMPKGSLETLLGQASGGRVSDEDRALASRANRKYRREIMDGSP